MNRSILFLLLGIIVLVNCALANDWENLFGSRPNIIHILADDLGYDDLGCYGAQGIDTPQLDKLAYNGVRFSDFYAPSSVCTPSRAAILTGKYSYKIDGCDFILFPHNDFGADPEKEKLISRVLKENGYATALVGKWHMGSDPKFLPPQHGFDYFFGIPYCNDHGPERDTLEKWGALWPEIPLMENMDVIERPVDLFSLPERFVGKVCGFIEDNQDKPFFIHYANIETHTPWYVSEKFQGKSELGCYGDAVQFLDWSVGEILAKLEELGLTEQTLVVFSSDNGPLYATTPEFITCYGEFGRVNVERERYLRAGKGRPEFQGGNCVPAVFSWEGVIPRNTVITEVAGGMDLFTTFAWLAGVTEQQLPENIDGKNIMHLLVNAPNAKSPHDVFLSFMGQRMYALRKGKWKLSIDHLEYVRLFDVGNDPRELNDLTNQYPEKMFELLSLARQFSIEMGFELKHR